MRSLLTSELITVWEQGLNQSPIQRALALLTVACPEISPEELAKLSIGQRDARLLLLREWTFGSQLVSVMDCPNCGDRLELNFNVADIRVSPEAEPEEVLFLREDEWEVQFRLPNSLDLLALTPPQIPSQSDEELLASTCRKLFQRCLLQVCQNGEEPVKPMPSQVAERIVEKMALADAQADLQLALNCPACGHQWQTIFDIVSFFWSEIDAWAYRTLREVHDLASAYSWRESDILAMSPQRRQLYLSMVN